MFSASQSSSSYLDRQKQEANKKATSWFFKKFSKKTQYIRDQDEETAQADRLRRQQQQRPTRHISAVTASQSNNQDGSRQKPVRQQSFLRQQLLEMKRQSRDTLLEAQQKRMAGEYEEEKVEIFDESTDNKDETNKENNEPQNNSGDDDDDNESVHTVDDLDGVLEDNQADEPAFSQEVSRRMSHATQLYEEAIHTLEHALHPSDGRFRIPEIESKPLLLGVKNGTKSEWI